MKSFAALAALDPAGSLVRRIEKRRSAIKERASLQSVSRGPVDAAPVLSFVAIAEREIVFIFVTLVGNPL